MKKILFIFKENTDLKTASVIRLKNIMNGFNKNNVEVLEYNIYSTNKFRMFLNYLSLFLCLLVYRGSTFVYGEVVIPKIFFIFNRNYDRYAERTEYPFFKIINLPFYKQWYSKLYLKTISNVNYFFTCSNKLSEYYSYFIKTDNIEVIPFFVSDELLDLEVKFNKKLTMITYCGYMGNNKDGIDDLLYSFSRFLDGQTDRNIKLKLIGGAENEIMNRLKALCSDLKITENVIFTGFIPNKLVLKHLSESDCHILTRPNNLQAQGGFPSKIAEYIATGKPVICTDVGEIKHFIKDDITFCEAGNLNDISQKIDDIRRNYYQFKLKGLTAKKRLSTRSNKKIIENHLKKKNEK